MSEETSVVHLTKGLVAELTTMRLTMGGGGGLNRLVLELGSEPLTPEFSVSFTWPHHLHHLINIYLLHLLRCELANAACWLTSDHPFLLTHCAPAMLSKLSVSRRPAVS